ncbi:MULTISPECIES: hypothetical protein [unclassified Microbacterium]|uniref:hypothetical protein n=1 Tax=unclassified Microbacterium TaxID=2609290 RepID=UPI000414E968|nr:hypothetical protein [Microbacterium sp. B24]
MDLADYFRGELSLRRLSVLIKHLPADAAVQRIAHKGETAWTREELLLTHLIQVWTGKPHPWLPKADRRSRYADLRARLEAQQRRLANPE